MERSDQTDSCFIRDKFKVNIPEIEVIQVYTFNTYTPILQSSCPVVLPCGECQRQGRHVE